MDLKANRIKSLKPIEKLTKLTKIDASQNALESLEGFGNGNSQLQFIVLFQNNLQNVEELQKFKSFTKIV